MMNKLFSLLAIVAFALVSCNFQLKGKKAETSEATFPKPGTYYGVVPCASCPGIATEITLNEDFSYLLKTTSLNEEYTQATVEGNFVCNQGVVELQGVDKGNTPWAFKVEDGQLRQLNLEGAEVEGDLAANYLLTKNGNPAVEDKKWRTVELFGQPVDGTSDEHYIIFHSDEQKIEAKADCNILQFGYTIRQGLRLIVEPGLSTLMACPDDSFEQQLIEAITVADNLSVSDEHLSLNKGRMAPLARFELVE